MMEFTRYVAKSSLGPVAALALLLTWPLPLQAAPVGGAEPTADKGAEQHAAQQTRKKRKKRLKDKRRGKKANAKQEQEAGESAEQEEAPAAETDSTEAEVQAAATAGAGIETGKQDAAAGASVRRSNKMEFDARLIRGETAGSGAVILFDRGHRELPSLTKRRTRFLDETIEEVYGRKQDADRAPKKK